MKKRGRPTKPFRTSWGEVIDGLRRRPSDGRWVIVATGQMFSEEDERRAVARFRRWQARQARKTAALSTAVPAARSRQMVAEALEDDAELVRDWDGSASLVRDVPEAELWAWMRDQLLDRPEVAARQTGIPELAYLADLPRPTPSPALVAVGKLYDETADITQLERSKSRLFWKEFVESMQTHEVATLRQLSAAGIAAYGQEVIGKGKSPTYVNHRFAKVKAVINHARSRGLAPDDCRHALDCCAVLKLRRKNPVAPNPIEPEMYHRLLDAADDKMRAMLLLAMNLALYPMECLLLDWADFDLSKKTFRSQRSKTGVIRIGVLWDRTIEGMEKLPRRGESVFVTAAGERPSRYTVGDWWRTLRKTAGVASSVKFDSVRDGAYTAAVEAGIDINEALLLAGHRVGISDYYVARRPTMPMPARRRVHLRRRRHGADTGPSLRGSAARWQAGPTDRAGPATPEIEQLLDCIGQIENLDVSDLDYRIQCRLPRSGQYVSHLGLPLCMALVASYCHKALPADHLYLGEIDLFRNVLEVPPPLLESLIYAIDTGEVTTPVTLFVPPTAMQHLPRSHPTVRLVPCRTLEEAICKTWPELR